MREYNVKAILLVGDENDHEHREIVNFTMKGNTAQDVKNNLINSLSIEIQEVDEKGLIISAMDADDYKTNSDFIHLK